MRKAEAFEFYSRRKPSALADEMRARGVAGLTRLPVTEEIAGSNPVGPAKY